jgi:hypothetical protein
MKRSFFLILSLCIISVSAFAKIPAMVTDAFKVRYVHATNVQWKHEIGKYEASFDMGNYRLEAKFNKNGKWLESQKYLSSATLPSSVKTNIQNSKYSGWKIESSSIEYLPNERPMYKVRVVKNDLVFRNLKFDHRGQLMNG